MGMPTVVGSTGFVFGANRQSRNWPTGHLVNDVLVVFGETANEDFPFADVPGGWAQGPNSPVGTGTAGDVVATRATTWWCRATSEAMPAIPFLTISPAINHNGYIGLLVRGCVTTGSPIVVSPTGSVAATAVTAVNIPGGDTTGHADCLVFGVAAHGIDTVAGLFTAWGATGLTNLIQRTNEGGIAGNGGGLGIVTGEKATAGTYGPITATLTTASVQARFSFALKGAAGAAPLTASDFCCGAECAAPAGTVTVPDRRHWHGEGGTPATSQTAIARNGGRAWRFQPTNDVSYRYRQVGDTKRWMRCYVYFPTLPSGDCELLRFRTPVSGFSPELRYRAATQDVVGAVGSTLTTAMAVVVGRFYRIAVAADVSTGTRTIKLTVDGVDKGTASRATASDVIDRYEIGASVATPVTADVVIDDIRTGQDVSLYPVGAGQIVEVPVIADGTHDFDAGGDFKYDNTTNIPLAAADTWTRLTGLLQGLGGFLSASAVAVGEYLEWILGGMPAAVSVAAVELVTAHKGSDANAHKQTLRLVDGAAVVDVFTDLDFSELAAVYHSKHYILAPSGVAWTPALINALRLRWGSSWTAVDIAGVPEIGGVMLEVDYVPVGGGGELPPDQQQHPSHTYPGAGDYTVRLTVADNAGLTGATEHLVTVS